jgi:hypothetical protein
MLQRDRDLSTDARHPRSPGHRPASAVNVLQSAVGNRGMARARARKTSTKGTYEHSVQIGKLGPIEIKDSNIADLIAQKSGVGDLVLTTTKGKHSAELERMFNDKTKIPSLKVQSITGENSWVIVTFEHGVISDYAADAASKTEHWRLVRFDAMKIDRTSIGTPRP